MKSLFALLVFIVNFSARLFAGDEKNTVASVLKSAIVYRNAAELSHAAKALLHQGNNELVIDGLSDNIHIDSIQIHCSGTVTVMSIEF